MAVDVQIAGTEYLSQSSYSVTEDATPIDPADTTGGVGQFTVGLPSSVDVKMLFNEEVTIRDKSRGTTTGTVGAVSGTAIQDTITVNSRTFSLTAERDAQPVIGTLEEAVEYYLSLVGIDSGIVVDDSIAGRTVRYRGWSGNVWDMFKQFCSSEQVELSLVSNNIVVRPLRLRNAETYRDEDPSWNYDDANLARSIEIIWQFVNPGFEDILMYPQGGWTEEVPVFDVNANETKTYEIPFAPQSGAIGFGVSPTDITQPTCVASVSRTYSASSVYSVMGTGENSDLPIPPAQWTDRGGSLTVALDHDRQVFVVTIVGSTDTQYAPYRIAMTAGEGNNYSSLRLVGNGLSFEKRKITLHSGVDHDVVSTEVGATIDSPFLWNEEQAYHAGFWALKRISSPRYSITVKAGGVNRVGDEGSYRYPTVDEFNAIYGSGTVDDFNTTWSGQTVADVNEYLASLSAGEFENQAFGNVSGARRAHADFMLRIRTATIDPLGISYTAEDDTTVDDWNAVWTGETVDDWNAQWAGKTVAQMRSAPLRRSV